MRYILLVMNEETMNNWSWVWFYTKDRKYTKLKIKSQLHKRININEKRIQNHIYYIMKELRWGFWICNNKVQSQQDDVIQMSLSECDKDNHQVD